jgi:hypothetical protein
MLADWTESQEETPCPRTRHSFAANGRWQRIVDLASLTQFGPCSNRKLISNSLRPDLLQSGDDLLGINDFERN